MSDIDHDFFMSSLDDLPEELYQAMGRALYRWSQLEASVCAAAVTLEVPSRTWLEGVAHLRGKRGFNVKGTFDQLRSAIKKWPSHTESLAIVEQAAELYVQRQVLMHGLWGYSEQGGCTVPAIHEWSESDYANYREVTPAEVNQFANDCKAVFKEVITKVIIFAKTGEVYKDNASNPSQQFGMSFHRTA